MKNKAIAEENISKTDLLARIQMTIDINREFLICMPLTASLILPFIQRLENERDRIQKEQR